jgi:hypothetical protein
MKKNCMEVGRMCIEAEGYNSFIRAGTADATREEIRQFYP